MAYVPKLPPNKDVPDSHAIANASVKEIAQLCKKFNIKMYWNERGVRKYSMTKTLRIRLNELREGECPRSWYHRYTPAELEEDNSTQTACAVENVEPPTAIDEDTVKAIIDADFSDLKKKFNAALTKLADRIETSAPPKVVVLADPEKNTEVKAEGQHEKFELLVKYVHARQIVLLVGPAGSGKTHLAEQAAKYCKLRFGGISCSVGMSEGQLMGRCLPFGIGGKFVYVKSQFVDFYENGGVFLFDELDAADANTMIVLNSALSNDFMNVPNDPENPIVRRHKDFVCIGAANTFGGGGNRIYVGRNQQDAASMDRFLSARIDVDYDPKIERAFIDSEVLEWGLKIRDAIGKYQLRRFVSTRVLARFTEQKKFGLTMNDFKRSFFLDWTDDDKRKVESAYKGITTVNPVVKVAGAEA